MGNVLLTLFYHPDEVHAREVCDRLQREQFNEKVVPYKYSSVNGTPPDKHLQQHAIEEFCDHIITVHSDRLYSFEYAAFVFSKKRIYYTRVFEDMLRKFDKGTYGFDRLRTSPVQIDLELNESNTAERSIDIVKGLVSFLTYL